MRKVKLDKKDEKYIIITLIIGFVAQFFIESGINISLSCFFMYIIHKYIATTENIKDYNYYKFIDKDKYNKGRKIFVLLVDVYIIIRIISMFIKPQSSSILNEMLLIVIAYILYESYLNKKYVINTNNLEKKMRLVFVRNKLLVSIILFIFVGFSYFTFNTLNKLSLNDYVKYGKYEYKLSNINDKRTIEIEMSSHYMMGEENEKNSLYFDNYLRQAKDLMRNKIFRSYSFISMLFMLALCFSEIYPKDNKVISIASNIFLVIFLVLSIFTFNFEKYDKEIQLSSYFHNYISK